jgi:hypothetical protein
MKEIDDVQFTVEENNEIQELKKKVNKVTGALKKIAGSAVGGVPLKTAASGGSKSNLDKPMTTQEKGLLKQNIMKLTQDKLQGVVQIIKSSIDASKNKDTLEFDIDTLPVRVCRELDIFVRKNMVTSQKSAKKKGTPKAGPKSKSGKVPKLDVISLVIL